MVHARIRASANVFQNLKRVQVYHLGPGEKSSRSRSSVASIMSIGEQLDH